MASRVSSWWLLVFLVVVSSFLVEIRASSSSSSEDEESSKEYVLTLDHSNFSEVVSKHDFVVVEFYAPWYMHIFIQFHLFNFFLCILVCDFGIVCLFV